MTSEDFLTQVRNPSTLEELKRLLGLPEIVEALHQVEETLCHVERRIDRLSEAIFRLTEAQARTDQKLERLSEKVDALAEAQARTDQKLERLSEKVERLSEKVERLSEKVDAIAEAQVRTDVTVKGLVEAQARVETTLERFMASSEKSMEAIRKELGALSETAGLNVEDIVTADFPEWLERHHKISATLQCPFLLSELGDEELDAFGEGQGPNGKVMILAEAKNRVRTREVDAFWAKAERVRAVVTEPLFPVLIGRSTYPDAKARAAELGLTLLSTSALRR